MNLIKRLFWPSPDGEKGLKIKNGLVLQKLRFLIDKLAQLIWPPLWESVWKDKYKKHWVAGTLFHERKEKEEKNFV